MSDGRVATYARREHVPAGAPGTAPGTLHLHPVLAHGLATLP
jgi:hypothetical protein